MKLDNQAIVWLTLIQPVGSKTTKSIFLTFLMNHIINQVLTYLVAKKVFLGQSRYHFRFFNKPRPPGCFLISLFGIASVVEILAFLSVRHLKRRKFSVRSTKVKIILKNNLKILHSLSILIAEHVRTTILATNSKPRSTPSIFDWKKSFLQVLKTVTRLLKTEKSNPKPEKNRNLFN